MKKASKGRKEQKKKSGMHRFNKWLHSVNAKCSFIMLISVILIMLLCCLVGVPEQYDLHAGSISKYTINASKDVVDEATTQERRETAASAVEPTYRYEQGIDEAVLNDLNDILTELRKVQQYGLTLRSEGETDADVLKHSFSAQQIDYAKQMITKVPLADYQVRTLLRTSTQAFDSMAVLVRTVLENQLNTTIREGQVQTTITTMQQILGYRVDTSLFQSVLPTVFRTCVRPNMIIDEENTNLARQAAMDKVEPVVYLQGQNIVREGERVTTRQMQMLNSLGLLNDNEIDWQLYGGIAMLTVIIMLVMYLLLRLIKPDTLRNPKRLTVMNVVLVVTTGIGALSVKLIDPVSVPAAMAAIMLTVLLGSGEGIVGTVCMSVIGGLLAMVGSTTNTVQMVEVVLCGLIGGSVSVFFLSGTPHRTRALICGGVVAVLNLIVLFGVSVMTTTDFVHFTENAWYLFFSGVACGLLAVAISPLIEGIFNLATPSRLMELCNPNHPLLRRLLIEASGTYHHAIIVANLAEAAAEKIGANPLLARAGAYFHDIGKLKRPIYFKENQMGENPHDHTDPYVSAAILTSHIKDGLILAQKHRLPKEIQTIIGEHHGDTPVMFFYHKAMQMSDGKPVDIADFRYDSKPPSTREGAIILLADTVEAAVRSMPDPTPPAILKKIEQLVTGKLQDGQLSNCPLTLKNIDAIIEAFASVLNGVFHERIEYPDMVAPKRSAAERIETKTEQTVPAADEASKPKAKQCAPAKETEAKTDTAKKTCEADRPQVEKPAAEKAEKPVQAAEKLQETALTEEKPKQETIAANDEPKPDTTVDEAVTDCGEEKKDAADLAD